MRRVAFQNRPIHFLSSSACRPNDDGTDVKCKCDYNPTRLTRRLNLELATGLMVHCSIISNHRAGCARSQTTGLTRARVQFLNVGYT
jgi:hypothetical protein